MSSRKQVVTAGILALAIAIAAIAAAAFLAPSGLKLVNTSSQAGANQGQLDILLTDPPTVPDGVTGVYVTYSNVAVHVSGAGNQSGWTNANTVGTIDLMKMVNVSTTIAAVKVTSGVYDALRFNISSAAVTYNDKNYTAFVPRAEISVRIPGGVQVSDTKTSAAIIDMQPTVLNMGSQSDPEFIIDAAASCYQVPANAITNGMGQWGFTFSIRSAPWWNQIGNQYTSNIQIVTPTTLSTSPALLSVTVENTGSEPVRLSYVSLMPIESGCAYPLTTSTTTTTTTTSATASTASSAPWQGQGHRGGQFGLPLCFTGSAFFVVLNNGTMISLSGLFQGGFTLQNGQGFNSISMQTGYELQAGQSVTLTFNKPITFGFSFRMQTAPSVVSGDQYSITVVGPQALAEYDVVAT